MLKRSIDLVLGAVLALFAVPLIAVLACLALVHLRAFPFFTQERIGTAGRLFRFVKVRTLAPAAPKYGLKSADGHPTPSQLMQVMRRLHLDELPQLFLVLMGRMSLVGPRPKMPDTYEPADPAYVAMRLQVAQGCTGLWQIGAHRDRLPNEAPEYDLFYVEHANVRLDLWILWHTFRQMLGFGELVTLADVPNWARRAPAPALAGVMLPARPLPVVGMPSRRAGLASPRPRRLGAPQLGPAHRLVRERGRAGPPGRPMSTAATISARSVRGPGRS